MIDTPKKQLTIRIIAEPKTGKTSIELLIGQYLSDCGIEVEISDVDMPNPACSAWKNYVVHRSNILKTLREKVLVKIEQRQI